MRRLLPVAVAALACAAAVAPAHAAKTTIKKSMWGPVEVAGESQFGIYEDLGVGLYQYTLNWADVAPTRPDDPTDFNDPAYRWPDAIDEAVREGSKRGIRVSLMVLGAPRWANGDRGWQWAPDDSRDFATFAAAASRRYPRVRHWMIWSEPTKASNWQPMESDDQEGVRRYARLLDDTFAALKEVTRANRVIGGNTFTVGTGGIEYTAPLRWIRALKLPSGKRPRMDMWGHNPFSARVPDLDAGPLGDGNADFSDLDNLARVLDRAYRNGPRKQQRHMKLFLSEFSLPTDHANFEFNFHVTRRTQAQWVRKALKITRSYKRIYTFGYLGLYDDALRDNGDQVERGLLTRSGARKPAYNAYRKG